MDYFSPNLCNTKITIFFMCLEKCRRFGSRITQKPTDSYQILYTKILPGVMGVGYGGRDLELVAVGV